MDAIQRFKQVRQATGLSQEEFGLKLGVTGAAISRIENGQRKLTSQMIKATCKTFDVTET